LRALVEAEARTETPDPAAPKGEADPQPLV
jgi:hypothetical protein